MHPSIAAAEKDETSVIRWGRVDAAAGDELPKQVSRLCIECDDRVPVDRRNKHLAGGNTRDRRVEKVPQQVGDERVQ